MLALVNVYLWNQGLFPGLGQCTNLTSMILKWTWLGLECIK